MPNTHLLQAVILDWAGTTIDHGCFAPVAVFVDVFAAQGVAVTMMEARLPMGKYKRDHIQEVAHMPTVAAQWRAVHGRDVTEADIDALFAAAIPLQIEAVTRHAALIPGVLGAIEQFRAHGLKIGSSTGYTRAMMEPILPLAAAQGYTPDALVCSDEVPAGRPAPWMALANAQQLGVYPMSSIVKIGDTVPDIGEGVNAGMWTIGLARTGSELGMTVEEVAAHDDDTLAARLDPIIAKLKGAGAHHVVGALADVPAVLYAIEEQIARGERP